mgnify:CR=1 FL=1
MQCAWEYNNDNLLDLARLEGGVSALQRTDEMVSVLFESIAAEDAAGVLVRTAELLASGHDPRRIAEDLLRSLRDAFLLVAGRGRVSVDAPVEEQEALRAVGDAIGLAPMTRALDTLGTAVVDMRGTDAADPRLVL